MSGRPCPSNEDHGLLVKRPDKGQSKEERWCGEWWDCPLSCGGGILLPSPELQAFLREQKARSDGIG